MQPIMIKNLNSQYQLYKKSNAYPFLNTIFLERIENYETPNFDIIEDIGFYHKFSTITSEQILNLRFLLIQDKNNEKLLHWCEKLLRYVEIRYAVLKKNEKKAKRPLSEQVKIFNQLLALFVEFYIHTNDLIYFNTALKINDLKWITPFFYTPKDVKLLNLIKKEQIKTILNSL
jgi:hypothetical protein